MPVVLHYIAFGIDVVLSRKHEALYLWFTILDLTVFGGGVIPPHGCVCTQTQCFATFSLDTGLNPGFKARVQYLKKGTFLADFFEIYKRDNFFMKYEGTTSKFLTLFDLDYALG